MCFFPFFNSLGGPLDWPKVVAVDSLKMQQKKWTEFFPNFTFLKKNNWRSLDRWKCTKQMFVFGYIFGGQSGFLEVDLEGT